MPVTARPRWDLPKTQRKNMILTVLFPKSARVRMPIQRQHQRADRVLHPLPRLWPLLFWQPDKSRNTLKCGLCVSLFGIRLLSIISREHAIEVSELTRLHSGRRARKVLKQCDIIILIPNIIALEHNSPFELPGRVALGQLGTLFHNDVKNSTNMVTHASFTGMFRESSPFVNLGFIPTPN